MTANSTTPLNESDHGSPATSDKAFQEQCLDAAERFSEHFLTIVDGLGETLYQMADQADDHELRRLYFTALQTIYNSRQKTKGDFKKQFLATIKMELQQAPNKQVATLFINAAIAGVEQLPRKPEQIKPTEEIAQIVPAAEESEDQHSHQAKTLRKGSWVKFHYPDTPALNARFTWVNPSTGLYLFIDRDGRKAPDKTPDELAAAFRNGHATLIQDAAQITRAASDQSAG